MSPDYPQANAYALSILETRLDTRYVYHSLYHTRDEVVPAALKLADLSAMTAEERALLETAAFYHDLGYTRQAQGHEAIGAQMAAEILPRFEFTGAQITAIQGMIMATRLPQTPHTLAEQILADADLSNLGTEMYWERSRHLREEMAVQGTNFDDLTWIRVQVAFMGTHQYHSDAAKQVWGELKARHLEEVELLLEDMQDGL
jgi:uncharacterized protein